MKEVSCYHYEVDRSSGSWTRTDSLLRLIQQQFELPLTTFDQYPLQKENVVTINSILFLK